jgi:hypothetical protein
MKKINECGCGCGMMANQCQSEIYQEKPQNYMFFGNLQIIKRAIDSLLEMEPHTVDEILADGHDWAADHIATSKDDIQEVADFLINKMGKVNHHPSIMPFVKTFESYVRDEAKNLMNAFGAMNEQYDETLKEELNRIGGNYQPIKLYSDKNEKELVGVTFFDEVFKNADGSVHLYPGDIKFSSKLGSKSGYKVLLFKCGTQGLLSKGNDKILYNSNLENYLKSKICGRNERI